MSGKDWKPVISVMALALVLGLPTLRFEFVMDSISIIETNVFLNAPDTGPLDVWKHEYWYGCSGSPPRGNYRPFTMMTFWAVLRTAGHSPAIHHAINILVHALACGALTLLLLRVGLPMALVWASGLAFASHPVHTEAFADVVGRAELLMALFTALALLAHVSASRSDIQRERMALISAGLLAAFFAMASKENGVAVVGLVPVVEGLMLAAGQPPHWSGRVRWLVWSLWLVPLMLYLTVRHAALGIWFTSAEGHVVSPLSDTHALGRLALALSTLAEVWRVSLPAAALKPDYYFNEMVAPAGFFEPRVLLGLLGLLILAGVPLLLPRREGPRHDLIALLGLAWFLVTWLPTSHVVFVAGELFAERWLYLPVLGLLLWAAAVLRAIIDSPRAWRALVAALVIVMSVSTLWHLPRWRDHYHYCLAAAQASPRSWRALYNGGTVELLAGRYRESLPHFDAYFSQAGPDDPRWTAALNYRQIALDKIAEFDRTGVWTDPPAPVPFGGPPVL